MLIGDFTFRDRFPSLDDLTIQKAITSVEVTWAGIPSMWSTSPQVVRQNKIELCYSYLVAWYLADMFPTSAIDIYTNGGAPLRSKDIGGTMLTFAPRKVQAELDQLTSNMYGLKALDMITTCPDRFLLR